MWCDDEEASKAPRLMTVFADLVISGSCLSRSQLFNWFPHICQLSDIKYLCESCICISAFCPHAVGFIDFGYSLKFHPSQRPCPCGSHEICQIQFKEHCLKKGEPMGKIASYCLDIEAAKGFMVAFILIPCYTDMVSAHVIVLS